MAPLEGVAPGVNVPVDVDEAGYFCIATSVSVTIGPGQVAIWWSLGNTGLTFAPLAGAMAPTSATFAVGNDSMGWATGDGTYVVSGGEVAFWVLVVPAGMAF